IAARAMNLLGAAYETLGRYQQSLDYKRAALEEFRKLGDRMGQASSLNNLGVTTIGMADYTQAAALLNEALTIAHEVGQRSWEMVFQGNLAGAQLGMGDFAAAETNVRQVIAMMGAGGSFERSEWYCILARAYLGQGRIEEALEAA